MQKLKWGDTLLGFEVEQQEWGGGICGIKHGEDAGLWHKVTRGMGAPIYPPRGWHGLSEAEIWAAIVGTDNGEPITLQFSDIVEIGFDPLYIAYHYDIEGFVPQAHGEKIGAWLQERIQALQNALTVIERLRND